MKLPLSVIIVSLALQLFLALSPIIPFTAPFWQPSTQQEFYSRLALLVGIEFVLMSAAVSLLSLNESRTLKRLKSDIDALLSRGEIRRISDQEFYAEFLAAVKAAKYNVNICYFAPYPPGARSFEYQDEYYRNLGKAMRRSPGVIFRRIVRSSEENKAWLMTLVGQLKGRRNAYVAVLEDLPSDKDMPLALSVQVVDKEKVWFVAIKSHEREDRFRDLYVCNPDFGEAMSEYYDRLWSHSVEILNRGEITANGKSLLGIDS